MSLLKLALSSLALLAVSTSSFAAVNPVSGTSAVLLLSAIDSLGFTPSDAKSIKAVLDNRCKGNSPRKLIKKSVASISCTDSSLAVGAVSCTISGGPKGRVKKTVNGRQAAELQAYLLAAGGMEDHGPGHHMVSSGPVSCTLDLSEALSCTGGGASCTVDDQG